VADGSIEPVRLKLRRADVHRRSFDELLRSFLEGEPYRISLHFDAATGWHSFVCHVRARAPEEEFALIFADMLSNLRATLDYLVWQLALASGNFPTDRSMFPVVKKPGADWASIRGDRLAGVADRWASEIERLQPYHRSDHPEWHPLAILDHVNNLHKHRTLPTTITSVDTFAHSVDVRAMPPGDRLDLDGSRLNEPLQDGSPVFRFRWIEQGLELPVHLEGPLSIRVSFQDGLGCNWTNDELFDWVTGAVRRFEPAFAS
jgi:hypothetical protein